MSEKKAFDIPTAQQLRSELDRRRYIQKYIRTLIGTLGAFIVAAALFVLLSVLIFPVIKVTGNSMSPTLKSSQTVMCSRNADIKKGDIIAFYHNKKILIKRVIAQSGDIIDISVNGTVSVNGNALREPYAALSANGECDITFPYTVPDSRFFVLGDDRAASVDSRSTAVGCIAEENIIGKVNRIILPLSDFGSPYELHGEK